MGSYGTLPVTGMGAVIVGGVAVARPVLAAATAGVLIAAGIVLRVTNRKKVTGR